MLLRAANDVDCEPAGLDDAGDVKEDENEFARDGASGVRNNCSALPLATIAAPPPPPPKLETIWGREGARTELPARTPCCTGAAALAGAVSLRSPVIGDARGAAAALVK